MTHLHLSLNGLRALFGDVPNAKTAREFARGSEQLFVRGQDHLALMSAGATGRQLSAVEALDAFGESRLAQILEYGTAILPERAEEPAATLRARRADLGLGDDSLRVLASKAQLEVEDIRDCEDPRTRSPIQNLERLARLLGLDDRLISVAKGAGGDQRLAVRLRTLGKTEQGLSPGAVITLSECAWVIKTEGRLAQDLGWSTRLERFEPSSNYGSRDYPAWKHGYFLARETRRLLKLNEIAPIPSMRGLCADLGIPLVQTTLPEHIAGATLDVDTIRGIVVNEAGANSNPWVRRATIAHELGHLLWDPSEQLETLRVDEYSELEESFLQNNPARFVEARANAFAIQFLLPDVALRAILHGHKHDLSARLRRAMDSFGVSRTAASYHAWNALDQKVKRDVFLNADPEPTDDWRATESNTIDFFLLRKTPLSRRGRFARAVIEAQKAGIISPDTASEYLMAESRSEYLAKADLLLESLTG